MGAYNTPPDVLRELQRMRERIAALEMQTQQARIPMADIARTANQSIPNAATTAISWQTANRDTAGMWSAGAPTKLVIPNDGFWLFGASTSFAGNATGYRSAELWVSGALSSADRRDATGSSATSEISVTEVDYLATGAYVELRVYQNSGAALDWYFSGISMYAVFLGAGE